MAIGDTRTLVDSPGCVIRRFRHHPGRDHRDPPCEATSEPELILTDREGWSLRTSASSGTVGPDCLLALDGAQELQIRHDERQPHDSQIMISLKPALIRILREFHDPPGQRLFATAHQPMTGRTDAIRTLLFDELRHDRAGRTVAVDAYVSALALEAMRAPADLKATRHAQRLRTAREFLDEHLDADVDLVAVAGMVHLSPGHFARLFRTEYGLTPRDYLLRARMRRAAQLIDAGLSLRDAAAQVGIQGASHFRESFRRFLGMAPSEWRSRSRP